MLEGDLTAKPPRISVYHDLPFAVLRYDPQDEWELRKYVRLLSTKVRAYGLKPVEISLSALFWEAIERAEGLEAVIELEKEMGFEEAAKQIAIYLTSKEWQPLPRLLQEKMKDLDALKHVVFLTRAASMAPRIYFMSRLLDEMKGKTDIITILCYPGSLEGITGLKFMNLDHPVYGNYKVKIYG
jgi:hypothetical protein